MRLNRLAMPVLLATLSLATRVHAQGAAQAPGTGAPNAEAATEIRRQFLNDLDTLQSKFMALANAFPAEKYS